VTPCDVVCPIFEKPPASFSSLIGVSLVTSVISAWIREPVARVAMNESIFISTTTVPLIRPTTRPIRIPRPIAGTSGTPSTTKWATATPQSVMLSANDRSKTRAASGMVTDSAARPVMALALRICFAVVRLGKVSGAQNENTTMIASQT
jgi:hypothetical protein